MKVAVYLRVSTKSQGDDDRYGLPKQRADLAAYLEREGHEVVATFEDVGFSGATADRPGLAQMLEAEGFEAVIVPCWDRLARDTMLDGYLRHILEKRGIVVLSATQANGIDPTSKLVQGILAAVAGYERHLISQRLAGAPKVKAAAGGYAHGKSRFGTQAVGRALVQDDEEAGTILEMRSLHDLGFTVRQIAEHLNRDAHSTRTGKPWGPSSVHRILARPR